MTRSAIETAMPGPLPAAGKPVIGSQFPSNGQRAAAQAILLAAAERHRFKDFAAACSLYRKVLRFDPKHPDAVHLLGMSLVSMGEMVEGERLVRRSIELRPDRAAFHSNLGNLFNRRDQKVAAITAYRRAIELDPDFADAHANLAGAFSSLRDYEHAESAARAALALSADHPTALANLAGALIGDCRFAEAEEPLQRALQLSPASYNVWYNLGHLKMVTGRLEEAESAFRQALALDPGALEAVRWLGYACVRTRKGEEADTLLRQFLRIRPEPSNAHSILGHLCVQRGLFEEGLALLRQGAGRPDAQAAEHSTLLFDLNYDPAGNPIVLREEHERWARRFALPHAFRHAPASTDKNPNRRLRIGFISPDFRAHSVSYFLLPLLRHLDRTQLEVFAYAYVASPDQMTEALRAETDHWQNVWGRSDDQIAHSIRDDGIDILVDLAGHTSDHRLLVLARRPAPIQATYLGYPNTTGMAAVDWRIVDAITDPPGAEASAVERLMRLDRCFLAYDPFEYPDIADAPCLSNGFVTFGSFNNVAKINDMVLGLWAAILHAVPQSRLILKHDMTHDPVVRARISKAFVSHGLDPGRIELLGRARDRVEHLATYAKIDIALDTFPYGGTTTTCEALWMGVPVVALAGTSHASRVGASILENVGLASCVAATGDEYVLTAAQLAGSRDLLTLLRQLLRSEMKASPLMDQAGLAAALATAFRAMWRDHCASDR